MDRHTVFLIGATGHTGSSIANALLKDASFHVIAGVRTSSAPKSEVESLKLRGAEIRIIELATASPSELDESLSGVRTIISAIVYNQLDQQKPLVDAAERVGVERFIPCDWGTACVPGLRWLHDKKLEIHDYIRNAGLGYTFIDVGWWMQITLPILDRTRSPYPILEELSKRVYGSGEMKTAVTDNRDIGKFVSRIIQDDRTLNKYVFCWAEEVCQNEVVALAVRISGRKIEIKHYSEEETIKEADKADSILVKDNLGYQLSLWFRGDNTIKNSKKQEYGQALDAKELYPDLKLNSLEGFAKEFYS